MEMEFIKCWTIIDREWINYKAGDSRLLGVFFTYEDARRHLEEMIDKTTKEMKQNELLKGYSIITYWDSESNCDLGASIVCEPKNNSDTFCYDYAIEQTNLFAEWTKIVRSPLTFFKKLNLTGKETA